MDMDVPYLHTGRTSQKIRTRDALIAAARQLLAKGATPTVEAAATEASATSRIAGRCLPLSFQSSRWTRCLELTRPKTRWHGLRS
jgi:hypothetical protein